jgi:hypothetical protein
VRYYRPLEKEEYRVSVHPETGKVMGFMHVIPEDQPGADIAPDEARKIAGDYLVSRGFDLAGFDLKETSSEKQKARRDHTLVWEARAGDARNVDDTRYRVRVLVAGDQVAAMTAFWKLPEAWLRDRTGRNTLSTSLLFGRVAILAGAIVVALWVLIQQTRKRQLRWRTALLMAAPAAVLGVAGSIASLPMMMQAYSTAIPMETFRIVMVTGVGMGAVGLFLGLAGAAGLIVALEPRAGAALRAASRRAAAVDALCAAALAAGLAAAVMQAGALARGFFHGQALFSPDAPAGLGAAVPAVAAIGSAAGDTLFRLAVLVLAVFVLRWAGRSGGRIVLLVLAAVVVSVSMQVHTGAELGLEAAMTIAAVAATLGFAWFARGNALAWALAIWTLAMGGHALPMLVQPAAAFQVQGWIVAAVWAAVMAWAVAPALGRGAAEKGVGEPG